MSAKDKATGKEQSIRITVSRLSTMKLSIVQDAEANAEADKKFEELVAARNTAEGMVHAARKTLEEAGEHATDDERAVIEAAIAESEEAIKGDDAAAMEAATTKLTEATGSVAQKMYAEQQAEGASAGAEGAEAQLEEAAQGDVADAEFEEVKEDSVHNTDQVKSALSRCRNASLVGCEPGGA